MPEAVQISLTVVLPIGLCFRILIKASNIIFLVNLTLISIVFSILATFLQQVLFKSTPASLLMIDTSLSQKYNSLVKATGVYKLIVTLWNY